MNARDIHPEASIAVQKPGSPAAAVCKKFEKEAYFPYPTCLSLLPLIRYWENRLEDKDSSVALIAREIKARLKDEPELLQPIEDPLIVERHKQTIDLLMTAVFPHALRDSLLSAATFPMKFHSFYSTPALDQLVTLDGNYCNLELNISQEEMESDKGIFVALMLLNRFYLGDSLPLESPLVLTIHDKLTGLERYYKVGFAMQFTDFLPTQPLKELSPADIDRLMSDLKDTDFWLQCLPPENFEIRGFTVITLTEVTEGEVLSQLKYDLLKKDAVISHNSFLRLQHRLRILFRLPDLKLGIAAFSEDNRAVVNYGRRLWKGILLNEGSTACCEDLENSVYSQLLDHPKMLIIEDLEKVPNPGRIETELVKLGVRNLLITPLYYNDKLTGILELGLPTPRTFNALVLYKLEEILPLFAVAIQRSTEEVVNRIQAIIKEEYTAVHPVVEWRFIESAIAQLNHQELGSSDKVSDIVFNGVYPLYGMSDIRGSSTERNRAIQEDLVEHLSLVREVLAAAYQEQKLPVWDELSYRVGRHLDKIALSLNSGDEVGVIEFLRREVDPMFDFLLSQGGLLKTRVQQYRSRLDPQLGVIYKRRKAFEESLMMINETVSNYLEEAENQAQAMFPHYFEKYKTDGVEYNMYVGASLVQGREFNPVYLKNLRLWQLMATCEVARKTNALLPRLAIPLRTTQLILAHGSPLSIRFRMDEKKFDVDGAYNIRYEIVKKRIDKALIKDSSERLTQPGTIAIVYAQDREADEYHEYIEYLQAKGYLEEEVERLMLEELQGVQGLKALRVKVKY